MKMLRTIRLDVSDTKVFAEAAEPGEWAVTGTFVFVDADPADWTAKDQLAFRNGWLGTESFGRATFAQVADVKDDAFDETVRRLAAHLYENFGAPDMGAAVAAAREEVEYAASLADHPAGTLLAIEREFGDAGVTERTRIIEPPDGEKPHARIWALVDDKEVDDKE